MSEFLYVGSALGLVLGALHAIHVYHRRIEQRPEAVSSAAYFAAWTLARWTLFGAYLLALWLIGAAGMGLARLRRTGATS